MSSCLVDSRDSFGCYAGGDVGLSLAILRYSPYHRYISSAIKYLSTCNVVHTHYFAAGDSFRSATPDGKAWTIFNPGVTEVLLLSEDKQVMPVPKEAFEDLIRSGRLTGLPQVALPPKYEEGRERLSQASPAALEEANHRYAIITGTDQNATTPARTVRRWRAQWSEALATFGNGFIGLLPQANLQGNRGSRLDERTEELLTTFITEHYETLKQQSMKAVYLLLQREAERRQIPVPSYTTFRNRLKKRPLVDQTRKRKGPPAATQV